MVVRASTLKKLVEGYYWLYLPSQPQEIVKVEEVDGAWDAVGHDGIWRTITPDFLEEGYLQGPIRPRRIHRKWNHRTGWKEVVDEQKQTA